MVSQLGLIVAALLPMASGGFSEPLFADVEPEMIDVSASENEFAPLTSNFHPNIAGFNWVWGYDETDQFKDRNHGDKSVGYMVVDLDFYTTTFTENSYLLLVHTKTTAVSGSIADSSGQQGFDKKYDLSRLTVVVDCPRIQDLDNDYFSGRVVPITYWPISPNDDSRKIGSYSYTSEFGISLELNASVEAGLSTANGVSISGGAGASITIGYSSSSTVTAADPAFSSAEYDEDQSKYNAYFYQIDYARYGRIAYTMDTYSLYEVSNSTYGFNSNSFVIRFFVEMEVVRDMWLGNVFAHYETIQYSKGFRYNLGYNPTNVRYYA